MVFTIATVGDFTSWTSFVEVEVRASRQGAFAWMLGGFGTQAFHVFSSGKQFFR